MVRLVYKSNSVISNLVFQSPPARDTTFVPQIFSYEWYAQKYCRANSDPQKHIGNATDRDTL